MTQFADRIVNVAVTGNLIRLELGTLQVPTGEGQKPQLIPGQTLVMPLDGFANSFSMLESVMKKLMAEGVIKQQPQAATSSSQEIPVRMSAGNPAR
jgi:hypothetical protein